MKKIVVIDGKSVFYRGYYAMGALSTSDGTPTGGVYGFAVIAMEIVRKLQPEKVVVAWDKAKTSVSKRVAIYPDYKAGRKKPGDDFYAQIPMLEELVAALGWGFVELDGYEADDIIGTIAHQASSGWEVFIVSSDLDMLQVVDENVKMYRLLHGFSKLEEIDIKAVEDKYGILKSQFLDLKAIKGDASDNIPGVPGVGEKGAVTLLNKYGSVDGIYEHIDEISGATHDKLVAGKDSAYMSYQLAKIMVDAPIKIEDIPDLKIDGPRVVEALKKLEFRTLIRKYAEELEGAWAADKVALSSVSELRRDPSGDSPATTAPWDAEGRRPTGAGDHVSKDGFVRRQDSDTLPDNVIVEWDVKKKMLEDESLAKAILGGKDFWDLNQGKFLLNPLERKTEESGQMALAFGETENELKEKAAEYYRQKEEFAKLPNVYEIFVNYDMPLVPILYKMEKVGIKISREHFSTLKGEYEKLVHELEQKIFEEAGVEFNVNSPLQLSDVLFEKLKLPTTGIKKTTRGYSTGAKELEKLKDLHPVVALIKEYREASKLLSTYIIPLPELADDNDRIHTTFTQNVTATGRLSSVNPNLQNIPVRTEAGKRIREGFVAEKGYKLIQADYSQFELRLAAVLAGDEALISDFNSGVDIHTKTASDVFGVPMDEVTKAQRRAAKTINFGVLYGMSAKGLADQTDMGFMSAKKFIDDYFEVRKPIRNYLDNILKQAREEGFVETFFGRRRPTPDVKSSNFIVRQAAERAACNMPIQGTEADLMKRAMVKVDKALPEGARLVLQIHDSLVVECREDLVLQVSGELKEMMEGIAPELKVKLEVEVKVGENLGEV